MADLVNFTFPEPHFVEIDSYCYVQIIFFKQRIGRRLAVFPFQPEVDDCLESCYRKTETCRQAIFSHIVAEYHQIVAVVVSAEAVLYAFEVGAACVGPVLQAECIFYSVGKYLRTGFIGVETEVFCFAPRLVCDVEFYVEGVVPAVCQTGTPCFRNAVVVAQFDFLVDFRPAFGRCVVGQGVGMAEQGFAGRPYQAGSDAVARGDVDAILQTGGKMPVAYGYLSLEQRALA